MRFSWDETKSRLNKKKHGLSFDLAKEVFHDTYLLSWVDNRFDYYNEDRWIGLGCIDNSLVIVVVHTFRSERMAKKLYALSPREKQLKKSKKSIFNTESKFKKEKKRLLNISDKKIDFSDISELDFDKLGEPLIGRFYRPIKKPISIRMDADVLEWFREHQHYQKLINQVCRMYMVKHRHEGK